MLTRLSCYHAMSCMKDQHLELDNFVLECYKKKHYKACYASVLYPVNGENLWTKIGVVDLLPPLIKRQSGKSKKKGTKRLKKL